MSVATLIIFDGSSNENVVTDFTLSAPDEVKVHVERKVNELGGSLIWNPPHPKKKNGPPSTRSKIDNLSVEPYLFLSWIEEIFGRIEHVAAFGESDHLYYVFRRRQKTPSSEK